MATQKTTRTLTHKFSDDETKELTDNLTSQMMDVVALQAEKKETAAEFKRKIDRLQEQNNRLAKWLHDGEREQQVACEVKMNTPKPGIKTIVRTDTYESWEEPMEQDEQRIDNLPGVKSTSWSADEEE